MASTFGKLVSLEGLEGVCVKSFVLTKGYKSLFPTASFTIEFPKGFKLGQEVLNKEVKILDYEFLIRNFRQTSLNTATIQAVNKLYYWEKYTVNLTYKFMTLTPDEFHFMAIERVFTPEFRYFFKFGDTYGGHGWSASLIINKFREIIEKNTNISKISIWVSPELDYWVKEFTISPGTTLSSLIQRLFPIPGVCIKVNGSDIVVEYLDTIRSKEILENFCVTSTSNKLTVYDNVLVQGINGKWYPLEGETWAPAGIKYTVGLNEYWVDVDGKIAGPAKTVTYMNSQMVARIDTPQLPQPPLPRRTPILELIQEAEQTVPEHEYEYRTETLQTEEYEYKPGPYDLPVTTRMIMTQKKTTTETIPLSAIEDRLAMINLNGRGKKVDILVQEYQWKGNIYKLVAKAQFTFARCIKLLNLRRPIYRLQEGYLKDPSGDPLIVYVDTSQLNTQVLQDIMVQYCLAEIKDIASGGAPHPPNINFYGLLQAFIDPKPDTAKPWLAKWYTQTLPLVDWFSGPAKGILRDMASFASTQFYLGGTGNPITDEVWKKFYKNGDTSGLGRLNHPSCIKAMETITYPCNATRNEDEHYELLWDMFINTTQTNTARSKNKPTAFYLPQSISYSDITSLVDEIRSQGELVPRSMSITVYTDYTERDSVANTLDISFTNTLDLQTRFNTEVVKTSISRLPLRTRTTRWPPKKIENIGEYLPVRILSPSWEDVRNIYSIIEPETVERSIEIELKDGYELQENYPIFTSFPQWTISANPENGTWKATITLVEKA